MDVPGGEQTPRSADKAQRRSRPLLGFALLTSLAALAIWGFACREGLRERWLSIQPIESLERLDAREDDDALVHYVYAKRLVGAGAAMKAWPSAARAASALPLSARSDLAGRIWSLAGGLAAQYGDARQAEAYLTAAARIRPRDPEVYVSQGILSLRRKQLSAAIAALLHAAELDPARKETWQRLGAAYLLSAETEKAADAFGRAVKLTPRDPQAHAELAEALGRLGQFDKAAAEASVAAELSPNAPEYATLPAVSRASSARTPSEYEAAVQSLKSASSRFPDVIYLHALLAGLHARFNQFEAARREVEIFLGRAPKDATGWLNLATLCERLGDSRGAATANGRYRWIVDADAEATRLKQQTLLHPSDAETYLRLATAMDRCGKYRETAAALARASELRPYDPEIPRLQAAAQASINAAAAMPEALNRSGDEPH